MRYRPCRCRLRSRASLPGSRVARACAREPQPREGRRHKRPLSPPHPRLCWDLEPDAYITYLKDDRWEDLRVAVAEYLKLDPLEIIFMSFLNEGRIDTTAPGWQFELALGSMWDEIVKIASSNLQAQDLGYADISWEVVIKDVIQQGNVVMKSLLLQEQELRAQGALDPVEEPEDDVIVVTTVTSVTYYDDPWFYDPYWYDPYW